MKHGYLLLMLPPIFVYLVATVLFELSATNRSGDLPSKIGALIASQNLTTLSFQLTEMKVRYMWFATTVVNFTVCLYAAVLCGTIIYRSHSVRRLMLMKAIGLVLVIAGIGSLIYSAMTKNMMFQLIYYFSFHTLEHTKYYGPTFLGHIDALLALANALAVIVPCLVLLAASSTLAPPVDKTQDHLAHLTIQMRHLRGVLNIGSAILVGGTLNMHAWLRWPTGLVLDSNVQSAYAGAALAITMFWGTTFTLMLITTYGPAASYLSFQARDFAERARQAGTIQDPQRWLHDNHFSITLGEQLPQIGVILGPLLAGPIGSFLMSHVSS
ncbi:MAG: hypothetical protein MRJ96_12345 [Nitrospirales bacterium]|nr:hypothetical protein [Nitrospira sp.]MDR4502232.1 hypothetical protein [Nitrospirales bacterium]